MSGGNEIEYAPEPLEGCALGWDWQEYLDEHKFGQLSRMPWQGTLQEGS